MPLQKIVNGVYIDLTDDEITARNARIEAHDLDLSDIRDTRAALLKNSDWTQIGDVTLDGHTAEEWRTYRQALRDLPSTADRQSLIVWPETPPAAKITRKVAAGDAARQSSLDGGGTAEEAQTAYDTAYAATD